MTEFHQKVQHGYEQYSSPLLDRTMDHGLLTMFRHSACEDVCQIRPSLQYCNSNNDNDNNKKTLIS